jgi:DNA polymerase phi
MVSNVSIGCSVRPDGFVGSLFSDRCNEVHNRAGFLLCSKALEAQPELATSFLPRKLMNSLMRHEKTGDGIPSKALEALERAAAAPSAPTHDLIMHLTGKDGAYDFDKRTNTKTVSKVLQRAAATEDISGLVRLLRKNLLLSYR